MTHQYEPEDKVKKVSFCDCIKEFDRTLYKILIVYVIQYIFWFLNSGQVKTETCHK